jgi:hypothetical protein
MFFKKNGTAIALKTMVSNKIKARFIAFISDNVRKVTPKRINPCNIKIFRYVNILFAMLMKSRLMANMINKISLMVLCLNKFA